MSKLKTSFLILVAAEFIYNISSYVINMGLGRMLGVADYGRYSLVIGFTTMIIILVGRGVPTAMAKRISENLNNWPKIHAIRRSAAQIQLFVIGGLTLLFYFSAPLIAHAFNDATLTPLFRISAFVIPAFALSSFHVLYFNGLKLFTAMTIMKISRGIFRIGWILGLAYTLNIDGALYGSIIAPLSVFVVAMIVEYLFITKKESKEKTKERYPWKKILSYAGGFMLFLLFYEFYVRTDVYLIKALTGSDYSTGLYTAAMTIALIPYYVLFALTFILFPTISDLTKKGDHKEIARTLSRVFLFLAIILVPAVAIMIIMPKFIITTLFGDAFAPGAYLIPLMSGGTIFGTLFYILASVFNGANMTRIPATIAAFAILFAITANAILLPIYGITATAITFSATSTFMGLTALIIARVRFFKN
jgi:O-antigen/teichoic acid export membrane protein